MATLTERKVRVVAISYDTVEVLAKFSERQKITFPLLSDPESHVIKAFALLNGDAEGIAKGVPYPGTVIIDQQGTVRAKLFFDGHRKRHTPADILQAVSQIER